MAADRLAYARQSDDHDGTDNHLIHVNRLVFGMITSSQRIQLALCLPMVERLYDATAAGTDRIKRDDTVAGELRGPVTLITFGKNMDATCCEMEAA